MHNKQIFNFSFRLRLHFHNVFVSHTHSTRSTLYAFCATNVRFKSSFYYVAAGTTSTMHNLCSVQTLTTHFSIPPAAGLSTQQAGPAALSGLQSESALRQQPLRQHLKHRAALFARRQGKCFESRLLFTKISIMATHTHTHTHTYTHKSPAFWTLESVLSNYVQK